MNLLDLSVNITCNDQASGKIDSLGASTIAKGTAIGSMVSQGITAAAGAIVEFGKQTIQSGMDFDSAMSQVAATMGVTTSEIGNLRTVAQEMGASTSFSATEAAEALNYMALAGYDSETAISMLPNVLNLAAAGSMELGAASDMVTDSQTALGLSLEETNVLVDQMAQTSSKSNTSVSQLGDAILTVGGTAKNLSGGITEMNTVLGVMADNGIKGSEAGTHLRNVILSLSAPTDVAAKTMAELGVSAVDADGNLRPLQDTMQDFNAAFSDMTAEERTQALNKIFNKTDLAAVNALLDTTTERYDELGGYIEDAAGAAEQMANTQLDNLSGDMTMLSSAVEGAQIALSDMMTPALREMAQVGVEGIGEVASALQSGDLTGAAQSFAQTFTGLVDVILQQLPAFLDAGLQIITGLMNGLAQGAPQVMSTMAETIVGLIEVIISNLPALIEAALQMITALQTGLLQALPVLIEALPQLVDAIVQGIIALLPILIQGFVQFFGGIAQAMPQIVMAIVTVLPQLIEGIVQGIIALIPLIVTAGIELFKGLLSNIGEIIAAMSELLPELINGIVEALIALAPMLAEAGIQLCQALIEAFDLQGLVDLFSAAWDAIVAVWEVVVDFFAAIWDGIVAVFSVVAGWFGDMFSAAWNAIVAVWDAAVSYYSAIWSGITAVFSVVASWFGDMFSNAWNAVSNAWSSATSWFGEVWNGITNAFSSAASWFGETFTSAWTAVTNAFASVASFFAGVWSDIKAAFGNAVSEFFNIGSNIVQGLINGVTSMIGAAVAAVGNVVSSIVGAAQGLLGIHSPSRVFAQIGDYTMQGMNKGLEDGMKYPINTLESMMGQMTDIASADINISTNRGIGGMAPTTERNFVFNVTINAERDATDYGRKIAEALYTEVARSERNWL